VSILVIGGRGYIGTALCEHLHNAGHSVASIDLCWFGNRTESEVAGLNYSLDFSKATTLITEAFDTIVLLAGHSSVQMCETDYYSSFNNNCRNFVELTKKIKPETKFIYASSSSVYGMMDKNAVADETYMVYGGNNNYDISKFILDAYMLNGRNGSEPILPHWYGLRFGTVNGPSPNTRVDLMINSMVHTAKQNGYINMSNEHIDRAILGLNDLCRAIETIIVSGTPDKSGVYNLSSFNASVGDIARNVSEITGANIIDHGLVGVPYDFRISNRKFENNFDFKFTDTIESITESLLTEYPKITKTKRDKERYYA
jgi:nucleoside-diphosphate-sugar epimerase